MDARMLPFLKGNILYIRIFANRFHIRNVTSGKELDLPSDVPFSYPRSVISEFTVAEALLKQGVKSVGGFLPPRVLMHPMEKVEDGLTQIEERVFLEVAYGSGARKAAVWTGNPLRDEEVKEKFA
jgi:hypothetical protein